MIRSEVLSKGVDRLLEQVLEEKSASFYNEIEGLVHNYLSSIGHYSRIERHKAGMDSSRQLGNTSSFSTAAHEGEKTINKLSDKEIDDFIKEETTRFLEATAEEKMKEKMARLTDGLADSIEESLPANEDNVIEMDAAVNEENMEPDKTKEPDSSVVDNSSKPADVIRTSLQDILKQDDTLAEALLKLPSQNAKEIEKSSVEKSDALSPKGKEKIEENEKSISDNNKPILKEENRLEITKDVQNKIAEKKPAEVSPNQFPNLKALPVPMSTDEETDDNGDSGIRNPLVSEAYISEEELEERNPKVSELDIELSDSDITVSSVHTSDLSSLDDSLSDLEFKDFEATSKKMTTESTVTKGLSTTDTSDALVGSFCTNNHEATSDADDEAAMDNSDSGNPKPASSRSESCPTSSQQESEEGSDERVLALASEEQRDAVPQRRSARVASKDKFKVDERDEVPNVTAKKPCQVSKCEESKRKVRRKRREIKEEKKRRLADSKEDPDEMSEERPHRRELRITSDSNESEDVKQSKRSRRTIRPTRCYSPSENN